MWRRFLRDRSANVALTFALTLPVLLGFAAFGVDEAGLYQQRRMMQSAVDAAAISAAFDTGSATQTATSLMQQRGFDVSGTALSVVTGAYQADGALAPAARFTANGSPENAVQVHYRTKGELYFASWWAEPPDISASATASVTPEVAFSVGSRLASLSGGIANALLDQLIGGSVSLDLMSYQALADANVDLFGFADALAGELHITAGTYDDVLTASATRGQIARALASLTGGLATSAAEMLASAANADDSINLTRLIDAGPFSGVELGTAPAGLGGTVSALDLLMAAAALSDGSHQASFNLGTSVPGIAGISAQLAIGAPPADAWFVIGGTNSVARTAQARLMLNAEIGGGGLTGGSLIEVPVFAELAYAEAEVSSATCPIAAGEQGGAIIATSPGILRLALGHPGGADFDDFTTSPTISPAQLVNLPLLKISAWADVTGEQTDPVPLGFSPADIAAGTVKTASTGTIVSSSFESLFDSLDLEINGLGAGLLSGTVAAVIGPAAPVLDVILDQVLDTLGLKLGEADVRVHRVACTRAVLVG